MRLSANCSARFWASLRPFITIPGIEVSPRRRAASNRPCPAIRTLCSSSRTGAVNPNIRILFAICLICLPEWVRAFFGFGRIRSTGIIL